MSDACCEGDFNGFDVQCDAECDCPECREQRQETQ